MQSMLMPQYVICPAIHLSVHPSVMFRYCNHIGWNTSKIISQLPVHIIQNVGNLVQWEHP